MILLRSATFLLMAAGFLCGCRSYVDSTHAEVLEGDHGVNYERVFGAPVPSEVTVVNSMVVVYSFRPGVVTTDDFEFELIAPREWIRKTAKSFHLYVGSGEFMERELDSRREKARSWYAPGPLSKYELYRDATSVGYGHMLVLKEPEADGRQRVFFSKH